MYFTYRTVSRIPPFCAINLSFALLPRAVFSFVFVSLIIMTNEVANVS